MTRLIDNRMLTLCYVTDSGEVLLEDERPPCNAEEMLIEKEIKYLDVEMMLYNILGYGGARLPSDPASRELVRKAAAAMIVLMGSGRMVGNFIELN